MFPAEFRLMVACLQAKLATATAPDWQAYLLSEINFAQLLAMCQHHEVTPLVYQTLQTLDLGEKVLEPFKLEVQAQTLWSFQLTQHVLAILRRLNDGGIPTLSHKGVTLSHKLFADIARRPTKDIDIVVPKAFYPQAKAHLHDLGYVGPTADTGDLLDDTWERLYLKRMHHVKFVHRDSGVTVELHWRLSPDFRGFRLEQDIWKSLEPYSFFGVATVVPPEAQLFALLCEHGAAHHYFRLKWLYDTAVLIDKAEQENGFASPRIPSLHNQMMATQLLCQELFALESSEGSKTQRWMANRILEQFRTFPITHITGVDRYHLQLASLNSRDPRLIWPVFRHYLYEDDLFRWHKGGWSSHLASLSRLLTYPFKRR